MYLDISHCTLNNINYKTKYEIMKQHTSKTLYYAPVVYLKKVGVNQKGENQK